MRYSRLLWHSRAMTHDEKQNTEFEFTRDMVETALQFFETFKEGDVLTVRRDHIGLWLVSTDRRAFLGLARLPEGKTRRLH